MLSREGALPEVAAQVKKILQSNRYISQCDIRNWVSQVPDIGQDLAHPYFDPEFLPKKAESNLEVFPEIRQPDSPVLKQANEEFIQREIGKFSSLFQQLEEFPLSEEQMRSAVINEDRNLLIAWPQFLQISQIDIPGTDVRTLVDRLRNAPIRDTEPHAQKREIEF